MAGGVRKQVIVELATHHGLTNATFQDLVPKHEVSRDLSIMDAARVPLKKFDTFKTVIPFKIFESTAMEKPSLLGVDG